MSGRRVIDCHDLWLRACSTPDGFRAVHEWLRLHGIKPEDVPLESEMVIEDSAFGLVIRYTAYLRNEDGAKYADPEAPDFAASTDRTAVLQLAPPADWLTPTEGDR